LGLVWRERLSPLGPVRMLSPPRLPRGDMVVFAGEPLQDRTSRRSFLFYAAAIRAACRRGKAVLGAVGVDLRSRISLELLPRVLRGVAYISVRDPRSRAVLRSLDIPVREARDVALLLPAPCTRKGPGSPVLLNLVPMLPGKVRREALAFARGVARELGGELYGLVMDQVEDGVALRGLPLIVPRSPAEALEAIASASLLIGSRLHSLEFALLCGTPFVAIPYAPKVESFLRLVERELPLPVPRLPGATPGEALEAILTDGYGKRLVRARERLRDEAEEGMRDVIRFLREMA